MKVYFVKQLRITEGDGEEQDTHDMARPSLCGACRSTFPPADCNALNRPTTVVVALMGSRMSCPFQFGLSFRRLCSWLCRPGSRLSRCFMPL